MQPEACDSKCSLCAQAISSPPRDNDFCQNYATNNVKQYAVCQNNAKNNDNSYDFCHHNAKTVVLFTISVRSVRKPLEFLFFLLVLCENYRNSYKSLSELYIQLNSVF